MLFILENKPVYAFKFNTTFLINDFFIYDKSKNNYYLRNNILYSSYFKNMFFWKLIKRKKNIQMI